MQFTDKDKTECIYDESYICSPEPVVEVIKRKLSITTDDAENAIYEAMDKLDCLNESCVVKKVLPIEDGDNVLTKYFKPAGPRNTTELLDNFNIDDVLEMWAKTKFPRFYHVYYQMIDFEDYNGELAKVDISKLIKKYDSLGVVMNTDVSTGSGIHWFCLYCDLSAKPVTLEYFNSSGNPPRKQIQAWLIRTKQLLAEKKIACDIIRVSNIEHQKDTETECGPYSLYYIWSRLNGIPYKHFDQSRIKDKKMQEFRETLFRHN